MALDIAHTVLATTQQRLKPLHSSGAQETAVFIPIQTGLFRLAGPAPECNGFRHCIHGFGNDTARSKPVALQPTGLKSKRPKAKPPIIVKSSFGDFVSF